MCLLGHNLSKLANYFRYALFWGLHCDSILTTMHLLIMIDAFQSTFNTISHSQDPKQWPATGKHILERVDFSLNKSKAFRNALGDQKASGNISWGPDPVTLSH